MMEQGQGHGQIGQLGTGMDTGSGTQPGDVSKAWPDDRVGAGQDDGLASFWSLHWLDLSSHCSPKHKEPQH